MKYSNGFDLDAILPALENRLGWRSEGPDIAFESFHALCTEKNLKDVQPTENIADDAWVNYKTDVKKDVIMRCLRSVFNKSEYIDQVLLQDRIPIQQKQFIENEDLFVGLRIRIAPDFSYSTWIKTVSLLFDSNVIFNLYLFEDGNPDFIGSWEVDAVANQPTIFDIEDVLLSYAKSQKTVFYLGYYQNDLGTAKAIREQVCWNSGKCFSAYSFTMLRSDVSKFNPAYSYNSYGLNSELHSFRDYTYKIERNPELFDEAIGLSMVAFVLEMLRSTTRSNGTERKLSENEKLELYYYLNGVLPAMGVSKTIGLNDQIKQKFLDIREVFYPKPKAQTVSVC